MFPEKSPQNGRPTAVTAAFWTQLAVAGLLAVLAATSVAGVVMPADLLGDTLAVMPGPLFSPIVLLALTALLTATAAGLRRGSRFAFRLSLAALLLPTLATVAALAFGAGTTHESFAVFAYTPLSGGHDPATLVNRLATWILLSNLVNGAVAAATLALAVVTVVLLLTGASRRFFAGAAPERAPTR